MKKVCIFLLSAMLSACGTYNAADTMARRDDATTDMARCGGGLGIDNKVGLIIKKTAEMSGGELSAQQSSEIFAKAITEGLITGDGKNYATYVTCILELDKRRSDQKTLKLTERIQQPTLKVYLDAPKQKSNDRFAKRLVVENTGEDLTELEVTLAPFLFIADLCIIREPSDCKDEKALQKLQMAFIPIENYYSRLSFHGRYKGELYSIDEAAPSKLTGLAEEFIQTVRANRTGSMTKHVITLVRVRYKDKFQNFHERFIDVSIAQRELPSNLGQALFAARMEWIRAGMLINAADVSVSLLSEAWNKTSRLKTELPAPWLQYRSGKDNA